MSAHAYIQYADVPDTLVASSRRWVESDTRAKARFDRYVRGPYAKYRAAVGYI